MLVLAVQHDGLQQEEADAVAALLAAASGLSSQDMDNSTPYPSGMCSLRLWLIIDFASGALLIT